MVNKLVFNGDVMTPSGEVGTLLGRYGSREYEGDVVQGKVVVAVQFSKKGKRGHIEFYPLEELQKLNIDT